MTTLYLALGGTLKHISTGFTAPPSAAVLCSYVYFDVFEPLLMRYPHVRQWCLDSGAYTAYMLGKEIKLQDYIDFCKRMQASQRPPVEIFSLDVIGDPAATLKNTEEMWKQGVEAIPCYHAGEPEHVLRTMARDYPKIAVGGAAGRLFGSVRQRYLEQCFARVWPKKIHAFGIATEEILQSLPFHSADASSWEIGPLRYGTWQAYDLPVSGTRKNFDLRPEVMVYLNVEAKLKSKWAAQMAQLEGMPWP
jgi:hypothetical protein